MISKPVLEINGGSQFQILYPVVSQFLILGFFSDDSIDLE